MKRARLEGESEAREPVYPEVSRPEVERLLNAEKKVHSARLAQLESKTRILKEQARQKTAGRRAVGNQGNRHYIGS